MGYNSNRRAVNVIPCEVGSGKKYFKALLARAQLKSVSDISGQSLCTSFFDKNAPLLVNNPERIEPRYINSSLPFAISFVMCDYSDNCDKTRWYIFSNSQKVPILPHYLEFGYDVVVSKNKTSSSSLTTSLCKSYL